MSINTQSAEEYSIEYWRERFRSLSKRLKTSIIQALIDGDAYYDSAEGATVYRNLCSGRAGLNRTIKGVLALEKHLEKSTSLRKKILKSQKIEL